MFPIPWGIWPVITMVVTRSLSASFKDASETSEAYMDCFSRISDFFVHSLIPPRVEIRRIIPPINLSILGCFSSSLLFVFESFLTQFPDEVTVCFLN